MSQYLSNLSTTMPWLRQNVTNPFGSDAFRRESSINQDNALNVGARNKSNILNNAAAMGYSTNGGLINSMLGRAGRDTSSLQAQGFRSAVGNATNRQMQSAGLLNSFQPLMTGSNGTFTNTQTTSGLGTWLPQLISAGAGAAMNAFMPRAGAASGSSAGALGMGLPNQVAPVSVSPVYNGVIGGYPGAGSASLPPGLATMGLSPSPSPYEYH